MQAYFRYGYLVVAIAMLFAGGLYLLKARTSGVFVGRDRVRAIAGGLCYLVGAMCFAAAFAGRSIGSLTASNVAVFLLISGAIAAPGGPTLSKGTPPRP